jgi:hypothetical protein
MSLQSLQTKLNTESDAMADLLRDTIYGRVNTVCVSYLISWINLRWYDSIDRLRVERAMNELHALNDANASEVAEKLDRWYFDSLIEYQIRST